MNKFLRMIRNIAVVGLAGAGLFFIIASIILPPPWSGRARAAAVLQAYTVVNAAPYQTAGLGYTQITATSSAQTLTAGTLATLPSGALCAQIWVSTANIRWRDDAAPTATVGVPYAASNVPLIWCGELAKFQFIAQSGSPVLDISFIQ